MRLTSIEANDFLSFADLDFGGLDPALNVIVGPNGAGKSNLLRVFELVRRVLRWTDAGQPQEGLQAEYAAATRSGVDPRRFSVRVGVELETEVERRMLLAWLRMALLSTFTGTSQDRAERADAHLLAAVDEQSIEPLRAGSVVVEFESLPAQRFFVGYEFELCGQRCCYVIRGADRQAGIGRGSLEAAASRVNDSRSPDLLLVDAELKDVRDMKAAFDVGRLLPDEGQFVDLAVQSLNGREQTNAAREFMRVFGVRQAGQNRTYMLDQVLARAFAAITLVDENRGRPRTRYSSAHLAAGAEPGEVAQTPLELMRLKNGDIAERRRFQQAQRLFTELTGASFDVALREAASSVEGRTDEEQVWFEIEVEILDGDLLTPLRFSGAGRWEALVLATALTATGTVTLLDEPALNLHPTLQRRLLHAIEQGSSQMLLVTHSPFLVPAEDRKDLRRIVRIARGQDSSRVHRAPAETETAGTSSASMAKRQQLMRSSDVRALLFAQAVLLVEGATEYATHEIWLPQVVEECQLPLPVELNLVVLSVNGDTSFRSHVDYLRAFAVPFVILSDSKALLPGDSKSLCKQFPDIAASGAIPSGEDFDRLCDFWADHGVFTLSKTPNEEIEGVFDRHDREAWEQAQSEHPRSKPRAGRRFAELTPPPARLGVIYQQMLDHLQLSVPPDAAYRSS